MATVVPEYVPPEFGFSEAPTKATNSFGTNPPEKTPISFTTQFPSPFGTTNYSNPVAPSAFKTVTPQVSTTNKTPTIPPIPPPIPTPPAFPAFVNHPTFSFAQKRVVSTPKFTIAPDEDEDDDEGDEDENGFEEEEKPMYPIS